MFGMKNLISQKGAFSLKKKYNIKLITYFNFNKISETNSADTEYAMTGIIFYIHNFIVSPP